MENLESPPDNNIFILDFSCRVHSLTGLSPGIDFNTNIDKK